MAIWGIEKKKVAFLVAPGSQGGLEIYPLEKEHYPLRRDLMRRYKDLPMDLADATMVVLAEALGISKIFTLDHKDFSIYRFKQTRRFTLIPPKLR